VQTIKFLFLAFLDFIAAIFIGTIAGFVIGMSFITFRESSLLKFWRQLDSPVKFTQIVDATAYAILAASAEGKVYEWNNWDCQMSKICHWQETSNVKLYRDEQSTTARRDVCRYEEYKQFVQPRYNPGNIVECVFTLQVVSELSPVVFYAILDNGTIWSWPREGVYGNEHFRFLLAATLIGGVAGILSGILVVYRKEVTSKYG
jgi:hypothetical protein